MRTTNNDHLQRMHVVSTATKMLAMQVSRYVHEEKYSGEEDIVRMAVCEQ